ncbi:hypothetical protein K438DRAFT_1769766 [Mycena galopus ATCC 62051]|nr:hypothetical protein K438DRAFT_1769766 [Mycena galopus ATCC 62051]
MPRQRNRFGDLRGVEKAMDKNKLEDFFVMAGEHATQAKIAHVQLEMRSSTRIPSSMGWRSIMQRQKLSMRLFREQTLLTKRLSSSRLVHRSAWWHPFLVTGPSQNSAGHSSPSPQVRNERTRSSEPVQVNKRHKEVNVPEGDFSMTELPPVCLIVARKALGLIADLLPRLRLRGPQVDFVESTRLESSRVTCKTWLDSEVNASQLQVTQVNLESGFARENVGWSRNFNSNKVDTSFRSNARGLLLRSPLAQNGARIIFGHCEWDSHCIKNGTCLTLSPLRMPLTAVIKAIKGNNMHSHQIRDSSFTIKMIVKLESRIYAASPTSSGYK